MCRRGSPGTVWSYTTSTVAWGEDRVRDVLERLYLERAMTPAELLRWRKTSSSPYPPQCATYLHQAPVVELEYICGHNPVLKARKVEDLTVVDEHAISPGRRSACCIGPHCARQPEPKTARLRVRRQELCKSDGAARRKRRLYMGQDSCSEETGNHAVAASLSQVL